MESNKDILFLAGLFPKEMEKDIIKLSKGNVQNAANVLQWNIVKGLDLNLKRPIKILNSIYIGSYPLRYKKLIIKSYKFKHCSKSNDYNVGFINFMGIKNTFRWIALKSHLKNWALNKNDNKVIVAYALTSNNLKAFEYVKKLNKNIKTCIIVPDLPQYMNTSKKKNYIYEFTKKIDLKSINSKLKYSDSFVLLTEHMTEKINICNKPYTVIEGISTVDKFNNMIAQKDKKDKKIIMYSGTLNEKYGILTLINAFKLIKNSNYRLIICGAGDSLIKVKDASKDDKRIIYKGLLPRDEIIQLQKNATVLINPRQNNEEFCRYSFPSKILEYLSSGVPTIAYKLGGMPSEYDDFIQYVEDNKEETLAKKIIEVCEKSYEERKRIGIKAKEFVVIQKNPKSQAKKIIEVIR